jgi:hypothetical protein
MIYGILGLILPPTMAFLLSLLPVTDWLEKHTKFLNQHVWIMFLLLALQ